MNRTKIEWVRNADGTQGYSWNPIRGICPVGCWYCYARRHYKRFKLDPKPKYVGGLGPEGKGPSVLDVPVGSRVFVCSTFEIFHPDVDERRHLIWGAIEQRPDVTFILLTKMPARINRPMPPNVWLGVTVEDEYAWVREKHPAIFLKAKVKFISFEPLLGHPENSDFPYVAGEFDWFILGRLTGHGKKHNPSPDTIKRILDIAEEFNRPVFMKNNLRGIWKGPMIQEFPK